MSAVSFIKEITKINVISEHCLHAHANSTHQDCLDPFAVAVFIHDMMPLVTIEVINLSAKKPVIPEVCNYACSYQVGHRQG